MFEIFSVVIAIPDADNVATSCTSAPDVCCGITDKECLRWNGIKFVTSVKSRFGPWFSNLQRITANDDVEILFQVHLVKQYSREMNSFVGHHAKFGAAGSKRLECFYCMGIRETFIRNMSCVVIQE